MLIVFYLRIINIIVFFFFYIAYKLSFILFSAIYDRYFVLLNRMVCYWNIRRYDFNNNPLSLNQVKLFKKEKKCFNCSM